MTTAEKIQFLTEMVNDSRTPEDEKVIHRATLARLQGAVRAEAQSLPPRPVFASSVLYAEASQAAPAETLGTVHIEKSELKRTVVIQWPDKNPEELGEGECRGLFVTRLNELAVSAKAKAGRIDDVRKTKTYFRAVGYYRGCCKFRGFKAGLNDMDVKKPSELKRTIFAMIQNEV